MFLMLSCHQERVASAEEGSEGFKMDVRLHGLLRLGTNHLHSYGKLSPIVDNFENLRNFLCISLWTLISQVVEFPSLAKGVI